MPVGLGVFLVLAVIFFSTLIRSTLGFGNALLAMPLLTLLIGVREASPLVALLGLVISLLMLLRGWEAVRWQEILVLLAASVPG
ncbi:MAG: sulfite exporter TauE/SafE family protein, partial [Anaerolineales bacterium]